MIASKTFKAVAPPITDSSITARLCLVCPPTPLTSDLRRVTSRLFSQRSEPVELLDEDRGIRSV